MMGFLHAALVLQHRGGIFLFVLIVQPFQLGSRAGDANHPAHELGNPGPGPAVAKIAGHHFHSFRRKLRRRFGIWMHGESSFLYQMRPVALFRFTHQFRLTELFSGWNVYKLDCLVEIFLHNIFNFIQRDPEKFATNIYHI